jgi:hypothetical protein
MPTITLNLGNVVSAFEDLPFGSYLGEIARIKLRQPTVAGKFAQLMVTYLVIDGDLTGRKQTQFLSLSPNALGFVKEFFQKFGFGDIPEIVIDDETDELDEPDLYGVKVIFKVAQDKKDPERTRVSLVSVEDDMSTRGAAPVALAKPKPSVAQASTVQGTKLANQVEADLNEPDPAAAKAAAKAARIAAAQAALEAAAAEDEDEEVEAPAEAPVKPARTAAPRPAAAAPGATPTRRTLR